MLGNYIENKEWNRLFHTLSSAYKVNLATDVDDVIEKIEKNISLNQRDTNFLKKMASELKKAEEF